MAGEKRFKEGVAGGTFDHFHPGHAHYLEFAFGQAEGLSIGITSDKYVKASKKDFKEIMEPYEERKAGLESYLQENGYSERVRLFRTDDQFGDTLSNASYDAIFVGDEKAGVETAGKINALRLGLGIGRLEVVKVPLLVGQDGEKVSSTKIRRGLASKREA